MLEHVISAARLGSDYGEAMLADLSEEQWTQAPPGLAMHPASIIGHLAVNHGFAVAMLEGRPVELPEGWMGLLAGSADAKPGASYPPKDELLGALRDARRRILEALRTATAEDMARPVEHEELRKFIPTFGALMVAALTVHESTHLGQLSAWRRAAGLELPV